ncbi:MAG: hypothetical protein IJQ82_13455 [Selenomonadaceae bacterium]|nr:hypothetical protein [Selenomonadaceae bacterium]
MRELPRFIKIGEERINVEEIVSYGIAEDEDEDRYLYLDVKTSDDLFQYYEDDVDFDIEDKISELDKLFLIN